MPILPRVGRRAFGVRLLLAVVYFVLALGAITMVYPFLLMLGTSVTSSTDTNEFRILPRYLYDETPLFAKYVDDKYAGEIELVNSIYHSDFRRLEAAAPPADLSRQEKLAREWRTFAKTLPDSFKSTAFLGYGSHPKILTRLFQAHARKVFGGDIQKLNRAHTEENLTFDTVTLPLERSNKRNWFPDDSPKMKDFLAWKQTLSEEFKPVMSVDALFARYLREDVTEYRGDIKLVAAVWPNHSRFDQITLAATPPSDARQRRDWEGFVRTKLPFRYMAIDDKALPAYRSFLQRRYRSIEKLNDACQTTYGSFQSIELPHPIPHRGAINVDWSEFIASAIPIESIRVDSPENRFRNLLADRFRPATGSSVPADDAAISEINREFGTQYASLSEIQPPYYASDALYVHERAGALRRNYLGRNFSIVLDYILLHGRSLMVTAIFCGLVILTTLIVNPLCAYALSRFQLPYAYRILLFVLATMAFPAEVAMIPNFLMLKELSLLNTYWALILPGMASGFSIFLLKGFFDSLPRELYEAGTIDGASETRMFFLLAIPLSKPIFAVIALNAFTAAYGAFMFALLVCQDPRMWTLMVWLYELQISNPQYIMMAGLAVAALPTLLVFVFAQNVIMRGIILPSEK